MMRQSLWGMIVGIVLSSGGALLASEADELRERAHAMRKEAAALAERGQIDQAERLEREAVELLQASERMALKIQRGAEIGAHANVDQAVLRLKERLQDLQAEEKSLRKARASEQAMAEVRERIAAVERELQTIQAHQPKLGQLPPESRAALERLSSEKLEVAQRRIHHLRVAAENLKLAEAHDMARLIMEKAEGMEREIQAEKKRMVAQFEEAHHRDSGPEIAKMLKQEIERLRAEVEELRQQLDKR